jgi:hypothetical protein
MTYTPVRSVERWPTSRAVVARVSRLSATPSLFLLASSLLYFAPYLIGSFEYITLVDGRVLHVYSPALGFALAVIVSLLLIFTFAVPKRAVVVSLGPSGIEAAVLSAALIVLGTYVAFSGHLSALDKSEMLEETNRFHLAFYGFSSMGFIFSILTGVRRHKVLFGLSVASLLMIVYIGHRSHLMLAIVGLLYIAFRNRPITTRVLRYGVLAFGGLIALALYKSVYVAMKAGNWDLVLLRLSPENIWLSLTTGMEQFIILAHLDFFISTDFRLACSNIWQIPLTLPPLADTLIERFFGDTDACGYTAQVQPQFFGGYSGGVAANIWAEFYGYAGYLGFPLLLATLALLYNAIERVMTMLRSPILVSSLIVGLMNLSFYIQRKDLLGAFLSSKRAFTFALAVCIFAWAVRPFVRRFWPALERS